MHQVDFRIKILTPLYMFGADQNWLELREASFKGMIRFWWRALKCCDNYEELKKTEQSIFGGTSNESSKSKIDILITQKNINISSNLQKDYNLKWDFIKEERKLEGKNSGLGYLFYSMIQRSKNKGIRPKSYFKPDGVFNISFYSRDDEALKKSVAAFWCAVNLGGFGARSRRGAGSLTVECVKGNTYGLNFISINCEDRTKLIRWLEENIKVAKEIIEPVNEDCKGYSNLSKASFIISKERYETWHEALSDIGIIYSNFRYSCKGKIQSGTFGFPVRHSNETITKAKFNDLIIERRSSPLLFKVLKSKDGYYWMALRFAGDLLPKGAKLTLGDESNDETPSLELIDKFWDELKAKNDRDYRLIV